VYCIYRLRILRLHFGKLLGRNVSWNIIFFYNEFDCLLRVYFRRLFRVFWFQRSYAHLWDCHISMLNLFLVALLLSLLHNDSFSFHICTKLLLFARLRWIMILLVFSFFSLGLLLGVIIYVLCLIVYRLCVVCVLSFHRFSSRFFTLKSIQDNACFLLL